MLRRLVPALGISLMLGLPLSATADTLLIEGLRDAAPTATARPERGMSMERVTESWGQPLARRGPVGDPPISRWEYDDFVVFFEYSRVIHAVRQN